MSATIVYLTANETRELLDLPTALELVEGVFRVHASGHIVWPDPMVLGLRDTVHGSAYRIKACVLTDTPVAGVRVTGYHRDAHGGGSGDSHNTRFVILSDPRTGHPLAVIDEHWTYNLRTCASAVLAIKYLARKDSTTVGLVGAGSLADTCLRMLALLFPVTQVYVHSRRPESRGAFADKMRRELGIAVSAVDTPQEAAEPADILVTCTSASQLLIMNEWLQPGVTVATLGRFEIEGSAYRDVDKVVVDDWEVARESEDIRDLLQQGMFAHEDVYADMAAIVSGAKPGRASSAERILVRADGLVTQDVAICHYVYRRACEQGLGMTRIVG